MHNWWGFLYLIGGILLGLKIPWIYRSYGNVGDGSVKAKLDDIGTGWSLRFWRVMGTLWAVGMTAGLLIGGYALLFGVPWAK